MPHKRKRNLTKKLSEVEEIAANDPSTEDFYGEGLVTHFYPNRAQEYEEYCLYDFVAKLTYKGKDKMGKDSIDHYRKSDFLILSISMSTKKIRQTMPSFSFSCHLETRMN